MAGVESLLEQNLIHQSEGVLGDLGKPRFAMLETVREFGQERFDAMGEAETTRDRHARHFLRFAEALKPELTGSRQSASVARLEADEANLRAALTWFRERGHAEESLRLAGALGRFWYLRGQYGEWQMHLEASLALPGAVDQQHEPQHWPGRAIWRTGWGITGTRWPWAMRPWPSGGRSTTGGVWQRRCWHSVAP